MVQALIDQIKIPIRVTGALLRSIVSGHMDCRLIVTEEMTSEILPENIFQQMPYP
jgi:hypothetical protein